MEIYNSSQNKIKCAFEKISVNYFLFQNTFNTNINTEPGGLTKRLHKKIIIYDNGTKSYKSA